MADGKRLPAAGRAAVVAAVMCVAMAFGGLVTAAKPGLQLERRQVVAIWLDAALKFPGGFLVLWAVFAFMDRRKD